MLNLYISIVRYKCTIHTAYKKTKQYKYIVFINIVFFFGWVGVAGQGREEEEGGKSHFLMLSRRAAVLYCVA